ncbi:MAG TPA: cell division protein FtsB [Steroidobacteraceae bacterium]|jgi:cell division protein FtsB|nr:cell division protein FtsB [Steroidobacteraceae bacterium]
MKWFALSLAVVVLLLQYRLWMSPNGVRELGRLEQAVAAQRAENEQLASRNAQLAAEVRDLKKGVTALEERARSDLGMIAANETFYQVVPQHTDADSTTPADPARTRTAAR